MSGLLSLDDAVLSEIISFIEPIDAANFITCSRESARVISQSDLIWHTLSRSCYGNLTKPSGQSWRHAFVAHYSEYPAPYLTHYKTITQLWNRLCKSLSSKLRFESTLLPGVSKETVDELLTSERFTALYSVYIPYDWLMLNRLVGGQSLIDPSRSSTYFVGVFGGYSVYDTFVNDRLIPFEKVAESTRRLLPITVNHYAQLAHMQSGFFAYFLDAEGQVVRRLGRGMGNHVVAPSFTAFLSDYVSKLEEGRFEITSEHGICRSLLDDPMGSVAVTEGIRVRVSVLYIPEMSFADRESIHHTFTYHITVDHDCSTSIKAKLTTRKWFILDNTGHQEEVEGPGVIGLFPEIYPGCPVFEYNSISSVSTPTGSMHGYFRFKVDGSERIIDVRVAPFHFDPTRNAV